MTVPLLIGGIAYGALPPIVSPTDGKTATAPDSTPTCLVIKNGTNTGDTVSVSAVGGGYTGCYKWSYDPASESEGDHWVLLFTVTISTVPYYYIEQVRAFNPERGTNGALTSLGATAPAGWINAAAIVASAFNDKGNWAKAGDEMALTSSVLTSLFTDTDTAALVNAIIARVESDLDGADLSTAAIAVAVRNELLNRVLSGNHETAGSVGKILQFLDAAISGRQAAGNVTIGGYAAGQDPATLLATTVTKVSTIDTLLAALTEVVSMVTRFKASALSQAPTGGAGSVSEEDIMAITSAVRALPNVSTGSARTGLTIIRTDRLQQDFTVTPGTYTRIVWSLKRKASDPDSAALLTVDSLDGILRINGTSPTLSQGSMGTLTYSSGTVTLDVNAEITTLLPVGDNFVDGIKVLPANRHLRNGPASAKVVEGIVRETD